MEDYKDIQIQNQKDCIRMLSDHRDSWYGYMDMAIKQPGEKILQGYYKGKAVYILSE